MIQYIVYKILLWGGDCVKKMKVCALLCAVALSANTVLPAMAAENVENTQATETMTEVEENQPVEE